MSKRRLGFSKLGMAKYISHLDLLRCFTRTIMRAGLPVKYSQGFNPHMKLTFSLPLPIGVTSGCECVDIEFEDGVHDPEIMEKLNENLPPDIRILSVGDAVKNANDIFAARYDITLHIKTKNNPAGIAEKTKEFFALPEVTIMKKTKKKGFKSVNLMEFIKSADGFRVSEAADDGNVRLCFTLVLSAGGHGNLKPELAINELIDHLAPSAEVVSYDVHRTQILTGSSENIEIFD